MDKMFYLQGKQVEKISANEAAFSTKERAIEAVSSIIFNDELTKNAKIRLGFVNKTILVWQFMFSSGKNLYLNVFERDGEALTDYSKKSSDLFKNTGFEEVSEETMFIGPDKLPYYLRQVGDSFELYKISTLCNSADVLRFFKLKGIDAYSTVPVYFQTENKRVPRFYCWKVEFMNGKIKDVCWLPFFENSFNLIKKHKLIKGDEVYLQRKESFVLGKQTYCVVERCNGTWEIIPK